MPGPARIYQYYTDGELVAELARLKQQAATGTITATGGSGKSSSMEVMSIEDRWRAYALEIQIRGGTPPPQKVTQVIRERNWDYVNNGDAPYGY